MGSKFAGVVYAVNGLMHVGPTESVSMESLAFDQQSSETSWQPT